MSLSINDARVFSAALKKARKKKHLTQAQCAELLEHSLSFQKDLNVAAVPQALKISTISAGHWISLQMTAFSRTAMTGLPLHIRHF